MIMKMVTTLLDVVQSKWILLMFFLMSVISTGCTGSICTNQEKQRQVSPDGKVDFVVEIADCGATTSTAYNIYVVTHSAKPNENDRVFHADKLSGLKIIWEKNGVLKINYKSAQIFYFTNFWQELKDDAIYEVQILERPEE